MDLGVRQIRTAGKGSGSIELTLPAALRDLVGLPCRITLRDGNRPDIVLQPDLRRAYQAFAAMWQTMATALLPHDADRPALPFNAFSFGLQPQAGSLGSQPQLEGFGLQPQFEDLGLQPPAGDFGPQPRAGDFGPQPRAGDFGPQPRAGDFGPQPRAGDFGPQPRAGSLGPQPRAGSDQRAFLCWRDGLMLAGEPPHEASVIARTVGGVAQAMAGWLPIEPSLAARFGAACGALVTGVPAAPEIEEACDMIAAALLPGQADPTEACAAGIASPAFWRHATPLLVAIADVFTQWTNDPAAHAKLCTAWRRGRTTANGGGMAP